MKHIRTTVIALMMMFGLVATPLVATSTVHAAAKDEICKGATGNASCTKAGENTDLSGFITRIINILLFLIGAISVIMIVVGGLRYVVSGGDSGAVNGAKNTILYAVVGLIVAFMAYAIVNFVVKNL